MKRLLCWCICLFVSNSVVGGQWLVAGGKGQPPKTNEVQITGHRSPATDHQLPCLSSTPACLQTLSDLAVQNNQELAVLQQSIQLQKKKLWTHWLNADGLNPWAMGLRLARNLAGGGDRATAKLELAKLDARRVEVERTLRQAVTEAVWAYETAQDQWALAQARYHAQETRVRWLEISYRFGTGTTEEMFREWGRRDELQRDCQTAKQLIEQRRQHLKFIIGPSLLRSTARR